MKKLGQNKSFYSYWVSPKTHIQQIHSKYRKHGIRNYIYISKSIYRKYVDRKNNVPDGSVVFTDVGSIPGHVKILYVPVFYDEVNMVLGALFMLMFRR